MLKYCCCCGLFWLLQGLDRIIYQSLRYHKFVFIIIVQFFFFPFSPQICMIALIFFRTCVCETFMLKCFCYGGFLWLFQGIYRIIYQSSRYRKFGSISFLEFLLDFMRLPNLYAEIFLCVDWFVYFRVFIISYTLTELPFCFWPRTTKKTSNSMPHLEYRFVLYTLSTSNFVCA